MSIRNILILLLALCASGPGASHAKTIWKEKNIYSSGENLNIGDIVVVSINDISRLRFNLSLTSSSASSIASNPDMTITGFLPKISSNKNISSSDGTQFNGRGQLQLSVASIVRNRAARGKYVIAGTRTYSFSGVTNRIIVTGVVDPVLVRGRTVDSNNVANFRIEIRASREGIQLKREDLKENEKAGTALTEEEKQKIILDYLQKMIREISR